MHGRIDRTALLLLLATLAHTQSLQSPPPCTISTPCPTNGPYFYCSSGRELNGCKAVATGPFSQLACDNQCLTVGTVGSSGPGGGSGGTGGPLNPPPQPDATAPSTPSSNASSGNSNWTFPPEPTGCAGLDVADQEAPILIYCEKNARPGEIGIYESKFDFLTRILRGEVPNPDPFQGLYPPQPGPIVYQSVQDSVNPNYIRELQFFVNKAAYLDHLTGVSGAALQSCGANMAWFSCWWFGEADEQILAIQKSFEDGLMALGNTNRSWAPLMWANDPSLKSGFSINRKVDLKSTPKPPAETAALTPAALPSCPGPALPLTQQQQAAPLGLAINITTVPGAADTLAADTNTFAQYIQDNYPCVMTFVNAKDPVASTASVGKYFAIAYFSNMQCLDLVLLNPPSGEGRKLAKQWLSSMETVNIRLFGQLSHSEQVSIPRGLKRLRPELALSGRLAFDYLMKPEVLTGGYMLNTVMNVADGLALTPPPPANCSGQAVVNVSAPILVYCEKRILPGQFEEYHAAFRYVSSIFRGEAQRPNTSSFYPVMPGITTFMSVQDSVLPDHVREIQFFSSTQAWYDHSTGVSGTAIVPAGLKQAWYSCAFMGLVDIPVRKILQTFIDFVKDEHNQSSSHIPLYYGDALYNEHNASTSTDRGWEVPGEIHPRLDLVSGFNKNSYVDPQRPPFSQPLPPCPGDTLTLTPEQQQAPLVLTINITAVKDASAAYKDATVAMASYLSAAFPCVLVFQNINDPALSTNVESKYFAVLHYSSYACMDAALLNPTTLTANQTLQAWFDTIQYMDISMFGQATELQQQSIVGALRRWQPAFNSYIDRLKFNYLMQPGLSVAGYMANTQVNHNSNAPFPGWANVPP